MEEINNLLQGFLCLILTGHILEGNSRLLLNIIHFRVALADAHDAAASGALHDKHDKHPHENHRQNVYQQKIEESGIGVRLFDIDLHIIIKKQLYQFWIIRRYGIIGFCLQIIKRGVAAVSDRILGNRGNDDLIILDRHLFHLVILHHLDKIAVGHFRPGSVGKEAAHHGNTEQGNDCRHHQQKDQLIVSARLISVPVSVPLLVPILIRIIHIFSPLVCNIFVSA